MEFRLHDYNASVFAQLLEIGGGYNVALNTLSPTETRLTFQQYYLGSTNPANGGFECYANVSGIPDLRIRLERSGNMRKMRVWNTQTNQEVALANTCGGNPGTPQVGPDNFLQEWALGGNHWGSNRMDGQLAWWRLYADDGGNSAPGETLGPGSPVVNYEFQNNLLNSAQANQGDLNVIGTSGYPPTPATTGPGPGTPTLNMTAPAGDLGTWGPLQETSITVNLTAQNADPQVNVTCSGTSDAYCIAVSTQLVRNVSTAVTLRVLVVQNPTPGVATLTINAVAVGGAPEATPLNRNITIPAPSFVIQSASPPLSPGLTPGGAAGSVSMTVEARNYRGTATATCDATPVFNCTQTPLDFASQTTQTFGVSITAGANAANGQVTMRVTAAGGVPSVPSTPVNITVQPLAQTPTFSGITVTPPTGPATVGAAVPVSFTLSGVNVTGQATVTCLPPNPNVTCPTIPTLVQVTPGSNNGTIYITLTQPGNYPNVVLRATYGTTSLNSPLFSMTAGACTVISTLQGHTSLVPNELITLSFGCNPNQPTSVTWRLYENGNQVLDNSKGALTPLANASATYRAPQIVPIPLSLEIRAFDTMNPTVLAAALPITVNPPVTLSVYPQVHAEPPANFTPGLTVEFGVIATQGYTVTCAAVADNPPALPNAGFITPLAIPQGFGYTHYFRYTAPSPVQAAIPLKVLCSLPGTNPTGFSLYVANEVFQPTAPSLGSITFESTGGVTNGYRPITVVGQHGNAQGNTGATVTLVVTPSNAPNAPTGTALNPNSPSSCAITLVTQNNGSVNGLTPGALGLFDDSGTSLVTGSFGGGLGPVIENSQCRIANPMAQQNVTGVTGNDFIVTFPIEYVVGGFVNNGFGPPHRVWGRAIQAYTGLTSAWVMGTDGQGYQYYSVFSN